MQRVEGLVNVVATIEGVCTHEGNAVHLNDLVPHVFNLNPA